MTPLRTQMIRDMQLQRLAPRTQEAYITAVTGLAAFYHCAPDRLHPEQIRASLHHLLVERHLAWSSCNQVACGRKFCYTRTLGWTAVHLDLPPRTGRPPLPRVLRLEELQRLVRGQGRQRSSAVPSKHGGDALRDKRIKSGVFEKSQMGVRMVGHVNESGGHEPIRRINGKYADRFLEFPDCRDPAILDANIPHLGLASGSVKNGSRCDENIVGHCSCWSNLMLEGHFNRLLRRVIIRKIEKFLLGKTKYCCDEV